MPVPHAEIETIEQAVVELDDGPMWLSAETSRRLACDASLVVMQHRPDGAVLDVGRRRRTVPPAIRRALAARDRQCRFPGCTARRCDAHHIHHWIDGGRTALDNVVLLCRRHHRAVHEEGFSVQREPDGTIVFRRPDGARLHPTPSPPLCASLEFEPLGATSARLPWSELRHRTVHVRARRRGAARHRLGGGRAAHPGE